MVVVLPLKGGFGGSARLGREGEYVGCELEGVPWPARCSSSISVGVEEVVFLPPRCRRVPVGGLGLLRCRGYRCVGRNFPTRMNQVDGFDAVFFLSCLRVVLRLNAQRQHILRPDVQPASSHVRHDTPQTNPSTRLNQLNKYPVWPSHQRIFSLSTSITSPRIILLKPSKRSSQGTHGNLLLPVAY